MAAPHLGLAAALARVIRGALVPHAKYVTLRKRGLIKVQGHGCKSRPTVTEAGRAFLAATGGARGRTVERPVGDAGH